MGLAAPAPEAAVVRHATVRWLSSPPHGVARVQVDSHAFTALPLAIHRGPPDAGRTTPAELLAAAYAAFVATRLARRLEHNGDPAAELVVRASCLVSDWESITIGGLRLEVHGRIPGLDEDSFRAYVQADVRPCGGALGLRDDMPVEVHTSLRR